MVYLTIFLTILISILVYSMDIAPSRREDDIHMAEPYILSFINQHQAAKDFLFHWMGHVDLSNRSFTTVTSSGKIVAVLLPNRLTNAKSGMGSFFTPVGQQVDQDTNSAFSFASANGYFKSAYVCLKQNSNGTQMVLAPCASGSPYVVTYEGVQDARGNLIRPDWWTDINGNKRAIYLEAWRRAIVKRTHGSYNCGFVQYAGDGKRWCYQEGKHDSIIKRTSCLTNLGESQSQYCIDNGQGCKALLPTGVASFLTSTANIKHGLDDLMVCISPVIKPYARRGLMLEYDGIDNRSAGAETHDKTKQEWYGSVGTKITGGEWDTSEPAFRVGQSGTKLSNLQLGSAAEFTITIIAKVDRNSPSTLLGPLQYVGTPSLAPGVAVGLAYLNGGCNTVNGEGEIHGAEDCFALLYRTNTGMAAFTKRYYQRDEHTNQETTYNNNVLSWTIVKKRIYDDDGRYIRTKLLWYGDGAPICNADDAHPTRRFWASWVPATGVPTKIGGENATTSRPLIYAIRYYDRALSRAEIMKNFEADVKRYGLTRWDNMTFSSKACTSDRDCPRGETCLSGECVVSCSVNSDCPFGKCENNVCVAVSGNTNYTYNLIPRPCETDCDMDSDCLSGKCINNVCTGYTQPEYIRRR